MLDDRWLARLPLQLADGKGFPLDRSGTGELGPISRAFQRQFNAPFDAGVFVVGMRESQGPEPLGGTLPITCLQFPAFADGGRGKILGMLT